MDSKNKAIIKTYLETVWQDREPSVIDGCFSDYAIIRSPFYQTIGNLGKKRLSERGLHAFQKSGIRIDQLLVNEDIVVASWRCSGLHENPFHHISPTHQPVTIDGTSMYKFDQGQVVQYCASIRLLGLAFDCDKQPKIPVNVGEQTRACFHHAGCPLTLREIECVSLWFLGFSTKESARKLGISPTTVETHRANVKAKLQVTAKTQLFECLRAAKLVNVLLYFGKLRLEET